MSCPLLVGSGRPTMVLPDSGTAMGLDVWIRPALFLSWTSSILSTATGPPNGLYASATSVGHPGLPDTWHYCWIPGNHPHNKRHPLQQFLEVRHLLLRRASEPGRRAKPERPGPSRRARSRASATVKEGHQGQRTGRQAIGRMSQTKTSSIRSTCSGTEGFVWEHSGGNYAAAALFWLLVI